MKAHRLNNPKIIHVKSTNIILLILAKELTSLSLGSLANTKGIRSVNTGFKKIDQLDNNWQIQ